MLSGMGIVHYLQNRVPIFVKKANLVIPEKM